MYSAWRQDLFAAVIPIVHSVQNKILSNFAFSVGDRGQNPQFSLCANVLKS